jgi:hypothetical protein
MRALFSVAAVLVTLLGIGWLGFPQTMLGWWAVQGDSVAIYMARRYGGLLFGYAVILWLGRQAPPSPAKNAILAGGVVVTTVMTALSLLGVLTGTVGPAAWSAVVIEAVLAAGFSYYYATVR